MKDKTKLNIDEKISLFTGASTWTTQEIKEIDLPSIKMTDGGCGVRNGDLETSCFPSPVAVASSFDVDAVYNFAKVFAGECKYFGTNLLLAPAMNIKRSPLCGRNGGYYSEDPVLTGEIAAAFINGLQEEGVGACAKHFAVYNQETERMTSNAIVDEQTLHEIYLKGFEIAVKKSKPASVMTSYNRSNGVYASENKYFLTDILRNKWGFDGIVLSDWGGVNDRAEALKAGLDLEMPRSKYGLKKIKDAYESGQLSEKTINESFDRLCDCVRKYKQEEIKDFDFEKSKEVALDIAKKSIVLLKNDDEILPLNNESKKIAIIGEGAVRPRIQSGGCDHTKLLWNTDFIEEFTSLMPNAEIEYSQGYELDSSDCNQELSQSAIKTVKDKDVVIFFLSLPEAYESEGYDRDNLLVPENQLALLEEICKVNENTVVVLQNGAPIDIKRATVAKAILETYLLGGISGKAVAEILVGKGNPSGKLAETFPLKIEDTPCYFNFPGCNDRVVYSEGLFVGYRYYSSKNVPVLYPFGHGLSYTKFKFDEISLSQTSLSPNGSIKVDFTISNVGKYDGAEIVQIYIHNKNFGKTRPIKELKKFIKCSLNKGESKRYSIELLPEDFTHYSENQKDFIVENGEYDILIGTSSENIIKTFTVNAGGFENKVVYTSITRVGEIIKTEYGRKIVNEKLLGYIYMAVFGNFNGDIKLEEGAELDPFFFNIMKSMPLQVLCNFTSGDLDDSEPFDDEKLKEVLDLLNNKA